MKSNSLQSDLIVSTLLYRNGFINGNIIHYRPVYTTANFGYGTDKNSTGTKK